MDSRHGRRREEAITGRTGSFIVPCSVAYASKGIVLFPERELGPDLTNAKAGDVKSQVQSCCFGFTHRRGQLLGNFLAAS